MLIRYAGPHPAINYQGVSFVKDRPTEVDDSLAEQLKKRPYFSGVPGRRAKAKTDADHENDAA